MRINRVMAKHFQRLAYVEMDTSGNRVHFVGGFNEAGKSSLRDAITFVLLGTNPRVRMKKQFRELISHGYRSGKVVLTVGQDDLTRNVRDGAAKGGPFPHHIDHRALELALGAFSLAKLKPAERRDLVFELAKVKLTADTICDRLSGQGCRQQYVDRLRTILQHGFDGAFDLAGEKYSEKRGAWENITGDNFGSKKMNWEPDELDDLVIIKADAPKIGDARERAGSLKAEIRKRQDAMLRMRTLQEAEEEQAQAAQARRERHADLIAKAGQLEELQNQIAMIEAERPTKTVDEIVEAYEDRLTESRMKITRLEEKHSELTQVAGCPACGTLLGVTRKGEQVVLSEAEGIPPDTTAATIHAQINVLKDRMKREKAAREREVGKLKKDLASIERRRQTASKEMDQAIAAQEILEGLEDDDGMTETAFDEGEYRRLEIELEDLQAEMVKAELTLSEQEKANDRIVVLKNRASEAAIVHKDAMEWYRIKEALGPGGVRTDLLREGLDPINDLLRSLSEAAGWPVIQFDGEIAVYRESRGDDDQRTPYYLLSSSARWRADALLQTACALYGEIPWLIFDEMDILEVNSRLPFMRWCAGLEGFESIFVMATLKKPARMKIDGVSSWWLDDGAISDVG